VTKNEAEVLISL